MTDIAFYHLQYSRLDDALPMLLAKTLAAGKRALVLASSEARVDHLDGILWTSDSASWLPHGTHRDGSPEEQPIWLTDKDDNPNHADFVFLTDGASSDAIGDFERCFVLFDGNDSDAVVGARERWKNYKAAGHAVAYWRQGDQGWVKQGE